MAIFRKVMINLAIVLGVLLAAFCLTIAIMYFANASVFGLSFKKQSTKLQFAYFTEKPAADSSDPADCDLVNRLEIYAGNIDVTLMRGYAVGDESGHYYYGSFASLKDMSFGLVKTSAKKAGTGKLILEGELTQDGTYILRVNKPSGIIFYPDCELTVWLDETFWDEAGDKEVYVETNKGKLNVFNKANLVGDVDTPPEWDSIWNAGGAPQGWLGSIFKWVSGWGKTVDTSTVTYNPDERIANLEFVTKGAGGLFRYGEYTGQAKIHNLTIRNKGANIDTETSFTGDVSIHSTKGRIELLNVDGDLDIITRNSNVRVNTVRGSVSYRGVGTKEGKFVRAAGGKLTIREITGKSTRIAFVSHTKNAQVNIGKLNGQINHNSTGGKITIREYVQTAEEPTNKIKTTKGNISIKDARLLNLTLQAKTGKITANVRAYAGKNPVYDGDEGQNNSATGQPEYLTAKEKDLKVISTSGKITVNARMSINGEISDFDGNLFVSTSRGKVYLKNLSCYTVAGVRGTGKGSVSAEFNKVVDGSMIQTYKGTANIKVPESALRPVRIQTVSQHGKVRLTFGTQQVKTKTLTVTALNGATEMDPMITVSSTKGNVKVSKLV